jgi:hypothetical protein
MISKFTARDASDPLVQYLMLSDVQRQNIDLAMPLEALQKKAKSEGADRFQTFQFTQKGDVLDNGDRGLLSSFLDFLWDHTSSQFPAERVDMRVCIRDAEFVKLFDALSCNHTARSGHAAKSLRGLKDAFHAIPGTPEGEAESKIVLRMTRGPSNSCINFHCDGGYATGTVQVALNDPTEFSGGRLIFFVNNRLIVPDRIAGSVCQHPRAVLHAVTALGEGTRKSLFVVDQSNGLGEEGVVDVIDAHVQAFVAESREKRPSRRQEAGCLGRLAAWICFK